MRTRVALALLLLLLTALVALAVTWQDVTVTRTLKVGTRPGFDRATISAATGVVKGNLRCATVVTNTDGTETLTAAKTGALVVATKADGTTTVTLPDPSAATVGVIYTILQTANQNLDIVPTTADGNSLVADGVATSDKASLATANHLVGAGALVIGISASKWQVTALSPTCPLTVEAAD